jgi:dTDP-4-amino-4,6-dideoxygalactose transaminase
VFLPTFTYTATAEVALLLGASPVFVDVDPNTYNIDPADLERQITRVKAEGVLKPKAIIAVDLFGLPADFGRIGAIAAKHGLVLLDDAAQGLGGAIGNRRIGALAPYTATSFFPAKPLGCAGDGGAIFCDDADKAALMRSIRFHGVGSDPYDVQRIGLNGRLDTLQAAILLAKLTIFETELRERDALAKIYDARLKDVVAIPTRPDDYHYAWAIYTIRHPMRDLIRTHLTGKGVPSAVYYAKPMHFQTAYQSYGQGPGSCPVAERLSGEVFSLPMHPYIDEATAHFICDTVIEAVEAL